MKITGVKHFTVHPGWRKNLIYVKIETDEGIYGWGEAYTQYDRDRAVVTHIEELGRYLVVRRLRGVLLHVQPDDRRERVKEQDDDDKDRDEKEALH